MAEFVGAFPSTVAMDENNNIVREAEAYVYDVNDTNLASPLPITDLQGVPFTGGKLVASNGIFPQFRAPAGVLEVYLKSGDRVTQLTDISVPAKAAVDAAGEAEQAAQEAASARAGAEFARGEAVDAAARAEAVGATSDEINANLIGTKGTKTEVALSAFSAGLATARIDPLNAVMATLDMRDLAPVVIASAGDSTTSPFSTGAFSNAWKDLAENLWPERPFRIFSWGKESNAYPASPTVWQDGATISDPGGVDADIIVAADSFTEHPGDLVGRPGEVGSGVWAGTSGSFIVADGACVFNPAYTGGGIPGGMLTAVSRADKDFHYEGDWRISSLDTSGLQRRIRAAALGTSEIRVQATGGTTVAVTVSKIISGTTTVLGTFPAGTIPNNTAAAWYAFDIQLVGTALTATLNGATISATLTSGDVAALGSTFGFADNSANAGIRRFEVRGTVTRPPVVGAQSPLGWATVYNAAVAGSTIAYQQARVTAMYPEQPDAVFIHHGHNYASGTTTPAQFFAAVDGFLAVLFAVHAPVPVVISSQNPEFLATDVDAARISRHLAIQRAIREGALARGWGYIPVFEAFAATDDGGKGLVQPDGIHPVIGSGTSLQAGVVKSWVARQSMRPS
ncbi:SGNH/GDSL hydrolase family protein [Microbacterium thalli]|uniref:SGNH/GDSL hydrolase family protein n=1 Tax=Microbacterium thalli TaxID=3027921 RepID=UPI0023662717|nr:SGNH/GDSL hydrolase family protein [Microbacterium thalli]MDD7930058.1 SGNH/GDSL hydrolase family protein [Microbacterium thalli]